MNFLFALSFFMINDDYKILSVFELKEEIKQSSKKLKDYDYQIPHSNAFVFLLDSQKVAVLPNGLSDKSKGILFNSRRVFEKFIKEDKFPIENEGPSIEELFQEEIISPSSYLPTIKDYLSNRVNLVSNQALTSQILESAQKKIAREAVLDKEYFYATVLLGSYIRDFLGAKWILLKQYGTFNPYYSLGIINKDNFVIELLNISDLYLKATNYSLDRFMEYPSISTPRLKLNSEVFKEKYSAYKILK